MQIYRAPVSGDLTLLKVLVLPLPLAEEVDDNVFELDKSSNWYSPGGTFPVLYLDGVEEIVFGVLLNTLGTPLIRFKVHES